MPTLGVGVFEELLGSGKKKSGAFCCALRRAKRVFLSSSLKESHDKRPCLSLCLSFVFSMLVLSSPAPKGKEAILLLFAVLALRRIVVGCWVCTIFPGLRLSQKLYGDENNCTVFSEVAIFSKVRWKGNYGKR